MKRFLSHLIAPHRPACSAAPSESAPVGRLPWEHLRTFAPPLPPKDSFRHFAFAEYVAEAPHTANPPPAYSLVGITVFFGFTDLGRRALYVSTDDRVAAAHAFAHFDRMRWEVEGSLPGDCSFAVDQPPASGISQVATIRPQQPGGDAA